ncbi:hypothetical protein KGM_201868A, partial [Danaus plexippus plexippus]
MSIYSL